MKKVITLLLIAAIAFAGYQYRDLLSTLAESFIATKTNPIKHLEDGQIVNQKKPFLTLKGEECHEFEWNLHDFFYTDLSVVVDVLDQAESAYVWGTITGSTFEDHNRTIKFYNMDQERMQKTISKYYISDGYVPASDANINTTVKVTRDYLLNNCFNKTYLRPTDELDSQFEPPSDNGFTPYDVWMDEGGLGMNAEEFYEKYKLTTIASDLKLEKIFVCNDLDIAESQSFWSVVIYSADVTCLDGEPHDLDWFPNKGETKTIRVAMTGTTWSAAGISHYSLGRGVFLND